LPATTAASGGETDARLYDHDKLRAWRAESGKSRERVCADLEFSAAWLAALETGQHRARPSVEMIVRLARYYGHQPGELLL
jgi:transcriptional regulator with XRE-family HTH domain